MMNTLEEGLCRQEIMASRHKNVNFTTKSLAHDNNTNNKQHFQSSAFNNYSPTLLVSVYKTKACELRGHLDKVYLDKVGGMGT